MRLQKYLLLFSDKQQKRTIQKFGMLRLITTLLSVLALAGMIFTYSYGERAWFFGTVISGIIIFAVNSFFERVFNKAINSCINADTNVDNRDGVSILQKKCFAKYDRYTTFLTKGNKFILILSLIFAAVCITFGILMFVLSGDMSAISFAIVSISVLLYVCIQTLYFLLSLIKENEFFDSCKGDISLLEKNK